jgi:hypothetical protein
MSPAGKREPNDHIGVNSRMTLSQLRHDIRNYLNAIKLSCALLQRQHKDQVTEESLREIDRSADGINSLISQFAGDADAPTLFETQREAAPRQE